MEYEDGKVVPSARLWIKTKITKPSYADTEHLLYFFDKYTTIVVGGARAMGKYYKNNRGKTLLDKLTVSDIAYSLLVYESAHDVWEEELNKTKTCTTAEEKRLYQGIATNKYHVKRGARLPLYQDGWTNEGKEYYKDLCEEFRKMMNNKELWNTIKEHWQVYTKKFHKYTNVMNKGDNVGIESTVNKENEVNDNDNDDDACIVSLPGELDNIGMDLDDSESDNNEDEGDSSNNGRDDDDETDDSEVHCDKIRNPKRRKLWPV